MIPVRFPRFPDGLENDEFNKVVPYNPAPKNAYPFTAYLGVFNTDHSKVFIPTCTGSLIDRDWVLTAAQCTKSEPADVVVFGDFNRAREDGTEQTVEIADVFYHENLNLSISYAYDIALIKLASKVDIRGEAVGRIPLLNKKGYFNKMMANTKRCRVAGWGVTFTPSGTRYPIRLVHQDVRFADADEVGQRGYSLPSTAIGSELKYEKPECPIGRMCFGDSGAPVFCKKGGAWIQTGIVSHFFTPDSCMTGIKAITNVYEFHDWIQDTMNAN